MCILKMSCSISAYVSRLIGEYWRPLFNTPAAWWCLYCDVKQWFYPYQISLCRLQNLDGPNKNVRKLPSLWTFASTNSHTTPTVLLSLHSICVGLGYLFSSWPWESGGEEMQFCFFPPLSLVPVNVEAAHQLLQTFLVSEAKSMRTHRNP